MKKSIVLIPLPSLIKKIVRSFVHIQLSEAGVCTFKQSVCN